MLQLLFSILLIRGHAVLRVQRLQYMDRMTSAYLSPSSSVTRCCFLQLRSKTKVLIIFALAALLEANQSS